MKRFDNYIDRRLCSMGHYLNIKVDVTDEMRGEENMNFYNIFDKMLSQYSSKKDGVADAVLYCLSLTEGFKREGFRNAYNLEEESTFSKEMDKNPYVQVFKKECHHACASMLHEFCLYATDKYCNRKCPFSLKTENNSMRIQAINYLIDMNKSRVGIRTSPCFRDDYNRINKKAVGLKIS